MNSESPGSPLRKKLSKQITQIHQHPFNSASSSWGSRLRKFRPILEEHRRNCDFEAWNRDLWQLGNWWLEVAGEEAAGIIFDLVDEFKKEQAQSKGRIMIPIACGDLFLDKLQAKALVTRNCFIDISIHILVIIGKERTSIGSMQIGSKRFEQFVK